MGEYSDGEQPKGTHNALRLRSQWTQPTPIPATTITQGTGGTGGRNTGGKSRMSNFERPSWEKKKFFRKMSLRFGGGEYNVVGNFEKRAERVVGWA